MEDVYIFIYVCPHAWSLYIPIHLHTFWRMQVTLQRQRSSKISMFDFLWLDISNFWTNPWALPLYHHLYPVMVGFLCHYF